MKDLMENKLPTEKKSKSDIKLWSWFKFIIGLMFSGLLVYKLLIADILIDFSKFDFNALLSVLLALFAISLSVAFYFKATDTSNLFYDNTYKFTKEISEILGRIEAGFGERLRHLDEGYTGLRDKFDNGHSEQNIKETKDEIEKEKEKLKSDIAERNKILNSLIEKTQLQQHEKEEIRRQLNEKELEISKQNREINFLKQRLHSESDSENTDLDNLPNSVVRTLVNFAKTTNKTDLIFKYPTSMLIRKLNFNVNEADDQDVSQLLNMRIIDENGSFTVHGIRLLRQIAERLKK